MVTLVFVSHILTITYAVDLGSDVNRSRSLLEKTIKTNPIMIAVMGVIGLVFSGIIVLAITPTLYANVPDSADVAKMFIEETTKLQGCGEDSACRHASEQALKTIEWYQKQNTARGTTQLFGMVLIILPAIAGVLSLRNS